MDRLYRRRNKYRGTEGAHDKGRKEREKEDN
jgi:hypothetical protein